MGALVTDLLRFATTDDALCLESLLLLCNHHPLCSLAVQDTQSTLYYAVLSRHTYECMPYVYTPVVGEACQKFSQIYRHTPQVIDFLPMNFSLVSPSMGFVQDFGSSNLVPWH